MLMLFLRSRLSPSRSMLIEKSSRILGSVFCTQGLPTSLARQLTVRLLTTSPRFEISGSTSTTGMKLKHPSTISKQPIYTNPIARSNSSIRLEQFTILVEPVIDNATYPVPLHFVHRRSPRDDAILLLFCHGWPGSFLEVSDIVSELIHPPNETMPAFHVVAPSIPSFAYSPTPRHPDFGPVETGHAYNELMKQLGYDRYVMQGGDIGHLSFVTQLRSFQRTSCRCSAISGFSHPSQMTYGGSQRG